MMIEKPPAEPKKAIEEMLPRLFATAYYLAKDPDRAEEAVQETILRFLEALRNPGRIRHPIAWCLQVLARVCRTREVESSRIVPLDELPTREVGPEQRVIDEEVRSMVRHALEGLPVDEREAICLHVFGDLTVRQVGAVLGTAKTTVHDQIRKGLLRLRKRLEPNRACAFIPAMGDEGLLGWLRGLPPPSVPDHLAASAMASASLAAAGMTTGIGLGGMTVSGGIFMSTLKVGWIGAGLVGVVAIGLGTALLMRPDEPRSRILPGSPAVGRGKVQEDSSVAVLQRPAVEGIAGVARKAVTEATFDHLRVEALAAINARDGEVFSRTFFTLLDAGSPANADLASLLAETGDLDNIWKALDAGHWYRAKFLLDLQARPDVLAGLSDFILARPDVVDTATLFALSTSRSLKDNTQLPHETHSRLLMEILDRAARIEGDPDLQREVRKGAMGLIGSLRYQEAIPALVERVIDPDASKADRIDFARTIARIGGDEAIAAFRRILAEAGEKVRVEAFSHLGEHRDMNGFLWDALDGEESPEVRPVLFGEIARNPENLHRLRKMLDAGQLQPTEARAMVYDLSLSEDSRARELVWDLIGTVDSKDQEQFLIGLGPQVGSDPRGVDLLIDRLRTGKSFTSTGIIFVFSQLEPRQVRRHEAMLRAQAADSLSPLDLRAAATAALSRIDDPGAVQAFLSGFSELTEPDRLRGVFHLRQDIKSNEAGAALEKIAASDPSEAVRTAATEGR